MGSENVELAWRGVETFNRGDLDAIEELWADDVELDFSASRSPYAGVYEGKKEARRFLEETISAWETVRWEPKEIVAVGRDEVLIDNVMKARGRGSGVDVEGHGAQLWTARDGLLTHLRLFQSRAEAEEWLTRRGEEDG